MATTFYIDLLSDLGQKARDQWATLVRLRQFNPSLEPGWIDVAGQAFERSSDMFVYHESSGNDALTGVVPYFVRQQRMLGLRVSVIELGSNLVSNHAEIVATSDPREIIERFLHAAPRWDVFHAGNLLVGGPTASAITAIAGKRRLPLRTIPADTSPYLPISSTWPEFLAGQNKKFRYKHRRRREFLEQQPDLDLRWFDDSANVESLLGDIMSIEEKSWKVKAGIDINSSTVETEYHRQLLPFLVKEGMLLANVLYREQSPVAYSLCCQRDGWVGQLKTSYDESQAAWSPGAIVVDASVERAFELSAREFDFLGDRALHKLSWTDHVRPHANYYLFAPRLGPLLLGVVKSFGAKVAVALRRRMLGHQTVTRSRDSI